MDEGIGDRMDREFCKNLNENKTEEKFNGRFLSLNKILFFTSTGRVRGVCHVSVGEREREGEGGGERKGEREWGRGEEREKKKL